MLYHPFVLGYSQNILFSALQKMSLDCPRATKILIEDVLMLGTVDEPAINERLCEYYSDTILLRRPIGLLFLRRFAEFNLQMQQNSD